MIESYFPLSWHCLRLNTLCCVNKPSKTCHMFWITFASLCESSNSRSCPIQPIVIQDVIASPSFSSSLLFIAGILLENPTVVADSRQKHVLIQVLPLEFMGCCFSTNLTSLMLNWAVNWDGGTCYNIACWVGALNCCRRASGCCIIFWWCR